MSNIAELERPVDSNEPANVVKKDQNGDKRDDGMANSFPMPEFYIKSRQDAHVIADHEYERLIDDFDLISHRVYKRHASEDERKS